MDFIHNSSSLRYQIRTEQLISLKIDYANGAYDELNGPCIYRGNKLYLFENVLQACSFVRRFSQNPRRISALILGHENRGDHIS